MRHVIYDTDNRPKSRRILTYTASPEDEGRPVRDIILYKWKLVAHDVARAKYETPDGITVNGEVVWVNRTLHEGDILRVVITDHAPDRIIPVEGLLDVIYEDEDLICINKSAGIVVHPSHGHYADSLANHLAYYFEQRGEPHEIRTIGRLDKDTSGLLLFGKSRSAVGLMDAQAAMGTRTKVYLALCEGEFAGSEGYVDTPIMREFDGNIKRIAREGGDPAFTSYKVEAQYDGFTLVRLSLMTGRTHQIRVHMSYIGHPLLGDPLYGNGPFTHPSSPDIKISRTALHASALAFNQPFAGNRIELSADLPSDMAAFVTNTPVTGK
jgi:23S rRNA pseudouridine1911/1915/1917 synthase